MLSKIVMMADVGSLQDLSIPNNGQNTDENGRCSN